MISVRRLSAIVAVAVCLTIGVVVITEDMNREVSPSSSS